MSYANFNVAVRSNSTRFRLFNTAEFSFDLTLRFLDHLHILLFQKNVFFYIFGEGFVGCFF